MTGIEMMQLDAKMFLRHVLHLSLLAITAVATFACAPDHVNGAAKQGLHLGENKVTAASGASGARARTYQNFISQVSLIKPGTHANDLLLAIGEPTTRARNTWVYNLVNAPGFPGLPPPAGVQIMTSVVLTMRADQISQVQWGWFEATGMAAP